MWIPVTNLDSMAMKCPACSNELISINAGTLTIDACRGGCGGLWFDPFELAKLDREPESARLTAEHYNEPMGVETDARRRRRCPRCADVVMMRRFFSRLRRVEIDECPGCGGIWLDGGELQAIQKEVDECEAMQPLSQGATRLVYQYVRALRAGESSRNET